MLQHNPHRRRAFIATSNFLVLADRCRIVRPVMLKHNLRDWSHPPEEFSFEPARTPQRQIGAALQTAAELAAGAGSPADISPDAFCQGMIVRHPEYGLGKILALSGVGTRRMATVAFASSAGEKKFVLGQSPLRPLKAN